jgi:hypothetical protein
LSNLIRVRDPAEPNSTALRPWLIWAGCGLLLVGALGLGPALLLGSFWFGSERTVYERSTSPDGWREARVQFDDAGAVSSFSRLVFIKGRWNPSDEPLLSCRAFWAEGEELVHLKWLDDRTLLIEHAFPAAAVQAEATRCGPITIRAGALAK